MSVWDNKMAIRGSAFGNIAQALAQMLARKRMEEEQQLAQNQVNASLYDTEQVRNPQTNPSISPLMQNRGNQINDIAGFNAVGNSPTFQTRQTFNPTMEKIAPLLTNPRTAPFVKSLLEGAKQFQGTTLIV